MNSFVNYWNYYHICRNYHGKLNYFEVICPLIILQGEIRTTITWRNETRLKKSLFCPMNILVSQFCCLFSCNRQIVLNSVINLFCRDFIFEFLNYIFFFKKNHVVFLSQLRSNSSTTASNDIWLRLASLTMLWHISDIDLAGELKWWLVDGAAALVSLWTDFLAKYWPSFRFFQCFSAKVSDGLLRLTLKTKESMPFKLSTIFKISQTSKIYLEFPELWRPIPQWLRH